MSRVLAVLVLLLLPSLASGQETPTPTPAPTPAKKPLLTREPKEQRDFATPGGSSLADIVRRSQEQRGRDGDTPKRSLGVITNDNLKGGDVKGAGAKTGKGATPTPRAAELSAKPTPVRIPEFRDAKGRNESDWKGLVNDVRTRAARAELRAKQLENEVKRLENEFYAWSDGNYRDRVIKPAWDQARDDLKKTREESDAARQALSDLEDDARRSGAPPGWLR